MLDGARVRPIDAAHLEAERTVERHCARVLGGDVEQAGGHASFAHQLETGKRERTPQPGALDTRIHPDHEDLAEGGVAMVSVMDLQPVEPGEAVVVEGDQEQLGVEPGLTHAARERRFDPASLLGMVGERPVVDFEPSGLVDSDLKRPHFDARRPRWCFGPRERDAHLEELAVDREARGLQMHLGAFARVEGPCDDSSTALGQCVRHGAVQQIAEGNLVARSGIGDESEHPVARREGVAASQVRECCRSSVTLCDQAQ